MSPAPAAGSDRPAGVGWPGPVLALEASTLRPSVALLDAAGGDAGRWMAATAAVGTADLAPAAAALLAAGGCRVADLAGIVVGTGPGSYTGTRAVIALARGMALATGRPLAGVPSVAGAARAALRGHPGVRLVVTLIDARRGESYRADYARGPGGELLVARPPGLVSGAEADPEALVPATGLPPESVLVLREPLPDAYDVGAVGRERLAAGGDDPASILPLYLKRSHAEIVFDERAGPPGLGGDRPLRP